MREFDYRTATQPEIEEVARRFVGRLLIDLQPTAPMDPSSPRNKGVVGRIYEATFGIPANSIRGPDFPGAGMELKSVPIILTGGEAKAKERISIAMIDFAGLRSRPGIRRKSGRNSIGCCMIFYGWEPLQPIARFKTLVTGIWSPDESTLRTIQADWERIRGLVVANCRSEVSESLSSILGAATKGAGHGSVSRAWSLKQPFVGWIYREMTGDEPVPSETAAPDPAAEFEARTLATLSSYVGRPFDQLASLAGREGKQGKAAVAQIVRALIGERAKGRSGDFLRFGVEVKTVPVDQSGRVVESMSFPAFVHEELVFEDWEIVRSARPPQSIADRSRSSRPAYLVGRDPYGAAHLLEPLRDRARWNSPGVGALPSSDRGRRSSRPPAAINDAIHPCSSEGAETPQIETKRLVASM